MGYIRSAMVLAGDEISGLPGQEPVPDLMASLVLFFGQMQQYDKKCGRVHVEEIWKKRLAYGFVTAQLMDAERALHGIDLHEDDWAALDEYLTRLTSKSKRELRSRQITDGDLT